MSIINMIFKPAIEKAKEEGLKRLKAWFEKHKHADVDDNGQEDFEQAVGYLQGIGSGLRTAYDNGLGLGVLAGAYWLKYSPKQTKALIASIEPTGGDIA